MGRQSTADITALQWYHPRMKLTPEEVREYNRKWRAANPEKCAAYTKKYRDKNKPQVKARVDRWLKKNSEKVLDYHRDWRKRNREKVCAASKKWRSTNPERQKSASENWRRNNLAHVNAHERERCKNDPSYRLGKRLRGRVRTAIKNGLGKKRSKTTALVGCSIEFLIGWLEAKFKSGMSWPNYGKVWEVDHIIPCASFDMTDESHQRSCFHYSNLQPLFVTENRKKYCTVPSSV